MRCGTCKYYHKNTEYHGYCHKHSPKIVDDTNIGKYPIVMENGQCGDYE